MRSAANGALETLRARRKPAVDGYRVYREGDAVDARTETDRDVLVARDRVGGARPRRILVGDGHDRLARAAAECLDAVRALGVQEVGPPEVGREGAEAVEGVDVDEDTEAAVPWLDGLVCGTDLVACAAGAVVHPLHAGAR